MKFCKLGPGLFFCVLMVCLLDLTVIMYIDEILLRGWGWPKEELVYGLCMVYGGIILWIQDHYSELFRIRI